MAKQSGKGMRKSKPVVRIFQRGGPKELTEVFGLIFETEAPAEVKLAYARGMAVAFHGGTNRRKLISF